MNDDDDYGCLLVLCAGYAVIAFVLTIVLLFAGSLLFD